jgi:hypothetical protein
MPLKNSHNNVTLYLTLFALSVVCEGAYLPPLYFWQVPGWNVCLPGHVGTSMT